MAPKTVLKKKTLSTHHQREKPTAGAGMVRCRAANISKRFLQHGGESLVAGAAEEGNGAVSLEVGAAEVISILSMRRRGGEKY